jgi:hypothetical protein
MKRIIVSRLAVPAIVLGLAAFASHRIAAQSSGGNAATYLMPPPEIAADDSTHHRSRPRS